MVALVELKGRINEQGKLEIELPENLPPGDVLVTIEQIEDMEAIKEDNARWDALFAATPEDAFDDLINEALEEDAAGLTDEWNPETDPERP